MNLFISIALALALAAIGFVGGVLYSVWWVFRRFIEDIDRYK